MCQGPIVVDEVLSAIIPIVLVKMPLEWLHLNHGVSLMPLPGLGNEQARKRFIELVRGDIQVVLFEPQPDVLVVPILLQLTRHHFDGNALMLLT